MIEPIEYYETVNQQHKLLNDLQLIEAGVIRVMPTDFIDCRNAYYKRLRTAYEKNIRIHKDCFICGSDLALEHHINSYTSIRQYNGDSYKFDKCYGIIHICPNCHYRIHNRVNPYFMER